MFSPVLTKQIPEQNIQSTGSDEGRLNLLEVHKHLLQYLKKEKKIPRQKLKSYLEQAQQLNPKDAKSRWVLMKIKGLLKYILCKRTDFHCSISNGMITIYEKSATHDFDFVPEPPKFYSQPMTENLALPSSFLTNDDFGVTSSQSQLQNGHSEDLFSDNVYSLLRSSQENYNMLKDLTQTTEVMNIDDTESNKKFNELLQVHDNIQNSSDLMIPTTAFINDEIQESINLNDFDHLNITNEELKELIDTEFEKTQHWVSNIIKDLRSLEVEQKPQIFNDLRAEDNADNSTTDSVSLPTFYSEENLKIIREVCAAFKNNLENDEKNRQNLDLLQELLNNSN